MNDAEQAFRALVEQSQAAAEAGSYEVAGRKLATAANLVADNGGDARPAYQTAGEYFRRADRPEDAANCLHLALAAPGDERSRGPARVMLAGVLTSIGRFEAANHQCAQVTGPALSAAIDTMCSIALALGERSRFDALVDRLRSLEFPGAALAARLRGAIQARLDGRFDDARRELAVVLSAMEEQAAGAGTVHAELAEVAMLCGLSEAMMHWESALEAFDRAGRRSLVLQAEAGRVRAALALGLAPMAHGLEKGLVWAGQQGLTLLSLDLERVLAHQQGDGARLASLADAALELGLKHRAGRTLVWHAATLNGPARLGPLQEAIALLDGDLPGQLLARAAQAEALSALSAAAGRNAAMPVVDKAEQIGMEHVAERMRVLV